MCTYIPRNEIPRNNNKLVSFLKELTLKEHARKKLGRKI